MTEGSRADVLAAELYLAHGQSLRRYAQRLTGDRYLSEDLVQETLLRAWQHGERLVDNDAARRAWLFRVAHNVAVDGMRARGSRPNEIASDLCATPAVGDHADRVLYQVEMARALRGLKPEHRDVLFEIFYRDRTTSEAARCLRIPHGTAKSRLFYGLRYLRGCLGGATARMAS